MFIISPWKKLSHHCSPEAFLSGRRSHISYREIQVRSRDSFIISSQGSITLLFLLFVFTLSFKQFQNLFRFCLGPLSLGPLILAQFLWLLAGHAPVVCLYAGLVVPQGWLVENRKSLHWLWGQGLVRNVRKWIVTLWIQFRADISK